MLETKFVIDDRDAETVVRFVGMGAQVNRLISEPFFLRPPAGHRCDRPESCGCGEGGGSEREEFRIHVVFWGEDWRALLVGCDGEVIRAIVFFFLPRVFAEPESGMMRCGASEDLGTVVSQAQAAVRRGFSPCCDSGDADEFANDEPFLLWCYSNNESFVEQFSCASAAAHDERVANEWLEAQLCFAEVPEDEVMDEWAKAVEVAAEIAA